MTRHDFDQELTHLIDSLSDRERDHATAGARDSLWQLFGRERLRVWQNTCLRLKVDGRWPRRVDVLKAMDEARLDASIQERSTGAPPRPCDCGGSFIARGSMWVYLDGHFQGEGILGALDRVDHPWRWAPMVVSVCDRCRARGFQAMADCESRVTGRKLGRGGFVVGNQDDVHLPVEEGAHMAVADPVRSFSDDDSYRAYHKARLKLIRDIGRMRLKSDAIADRLCELADEFPVKAQVLVQEAAAFAGRDSRG